MQILVLFAHPVESSFQAGLHQTIVSTLRASGHDVDDCDLYAEHFDPVMDRAERLAYLDTAINQRRVKPYVDRLLAAEALVLCFPIWSYGPPAILKGFFDRLLIPGVAFDLRGGKVIPKLSLRKLSAVATYGQSSWLAWLNGDPARHLVTGYLRRTMRPTNRVRYIALYDMNRATPRRRASLVAVVQREMASI
jgi:NAD(P)H dehydrogenase (quinone)